MINCHGHKDTKILNKISKIKKKIQEENWYELGFTYDKQTTLREAMMALVEI